MKKEKFRKFIDFLNEKKGILIFILILVSPIISFLWSKYKEEFQCKILGEVLVTKVIDGDTILVEGGKIIRLLGIDADEKGYLCFESAKKFLEEAILNKKVTLERDRKNTDIYGRCLRYIFLEGRNINLELVEKGEAVCRFEPPNLKYQKECEEKEKKAREKKLGCKWQERKFTEKAIEACKAKNYIGQRKVIEDYVVSTFRSKKNNVFLNFGKPYPNQCFSAIIFGSALHRFPFDPEVFYLKKKVRIFGEIKEYKGRPEIIIENPNQIELIEEK